MSNQSGFGQQMSSAAQQQAAGGMPGLTSALAGADLGKDGDDDDDIPDLEPAEDAPKKEEDDDDGDLDETGLEAKDIELVMSQVRTCD